MTKSKMFFAYVCLVGLPLLGLLGIMRAGRRLSAPLFVGGDWNLEADFSALEGKPCANLLSSGKQPFLSISESGPELVATLGSSPAATLTGIIQGNSLTLADRGFQPAAGGAENGCAQDAIDITATVEGQGRERVLAGLLRFRGCPACAPISFRALRTSRGKQGGR